MAQLSIKGIFIGAFIGTTLVLPVAGCGGGGGNGFASTNITVSAIIGTWTRSELSVSGQSVSCPNSLTVNSIVADSCVGGETITFNGDGSYAISDPAAKFGAVYTETGTYTVGGSSLTLTRLATDVVNTVVTPGASVTLSSPVVIPNAFSFTGNNSFTLQPAVPASNANYTVPETSNGTTVTSTYTRD